MEIIPIDAFKGVRGKICSGSLDSARFNKTSNKSHSYHYTKKFNELSEAQQNSCLSFGQCASIAGKWLIANHPSPEHPKGTPIYRSIMRKFHNQKKVSNKMAYLTQMIMAHKL